MLVNADIRRWSLIVTLCGSAFAAAHPTTVVAAASAAGIAGRGFCPATLITTDTTIGALDFQYDGTQLTIAGATVTIAGHHSFCRLDLVQGAVLTHAAADSQGIDVEVTGSASVDATSVVDASGRGWLRREGPGQPAVGTNGGAGHGGRGGRASGGTPGGASYGAVESPRAPGSGGGGATGGAGGGVVRLSIADTLVVYGRITADGAAPGLGSHSGGAGGSIALSAGTFIGTGGITADGGSAITAGGSGGGRIAITVGQDTFTGAVSAFGGSGGERGGAGTVFRRESSTSSTELRVDNGGLPAGARTDLNGFETIDGNLIVTEGGVLQGPSRLYVTGDLSITTTGAVSANGSGYGHDNGPGTGTGGGGGGHGGPGGGGVGGGGGGLAYDSPYYPVYPGSGGSGSAAGAGGGSIRLDVQGELLIDGRLSADGVGPGSGGQGGGAGGAIHVNCASLAGAGLVTANGGSSVTGGGGGGGRVALYAGDCHAHFDGSTQVVVAGGAGGRAGGPGTVFLGYERVRASGIEDGFALPAEPTTASAALQSALLPLALQPFDVDPAGGAVATTLPSPATAIVAGTIVLPVRAHGSGNPANDRVILGFADGAGFTEAWSRYLGSTNNAGDPGLVGAPWTSGRDTTLVLDLAALPLNGGGTLDLTAAISQNGSIDVIVEHHTAVDFVMLTGCAGAADVAAVGDGSGEAPPASNLAVSSHPNPFNPRTTIRFVVDEPGPVNLAVYDVRGREVATLLDGDVAAGPHEVVFEARQLPAGLYLAQLLTDRGVATVKLVLVK